jgi:hypothetical protein
MADTATLTTWFFAFVHDFLPFIVLAGLALLFSFYFGRDRFAPLVAGLYAALALYTAFPYGSSISGPYLQIGLYIVFTIIGFLAFYGLSFFFARSSTEFFTQLILSILVAGFVLGISIHVLPVQQIYHFTDATKALFASDQAYFWWLAAPLVGIFFFGK